MSTGGDVRFMPLVKGATTPAAFNVESLIAQMTDDTYFIPRYQRDSAEWDVPKRSLFIESLINNLTIPPLIAYPEDDPNTGIERNEIVDGQQRVSAIRDFVSGNFALSSEDDVEYAENVGAIIQGKKFGELPVLIQKQILRYSLNFIRLPKNLPLNMRLEIFRRINEGGVPLSAHDLRLALFGQSDRVTFMRLAGIFDPAREGSRRMIEGGKKQFDLDYPWHNSSAWKVWWEDTAQSVGQSPSQMFLYYCIARDLTAVTTLLDSSKIQQTLKLKHDKTTASVLDLYCAQAQHESNPQAARLLADIGTIRRWFRDFETWFNAIKSAKVPRLPVNSSTKIAFFIAFAAEIWQSPDRVTEKQWELTQVFLTQGPARIEEELGMQFPSTRGKWPGQRKQIERTKEICQKIAQA